MWLSRKKENIILEFDAEEAWLLFLLCGFVVSVEAVSRLPRDVRGRGGGRQKAQRLSSYICPLHPFLLSSTIGSGIMTLTGTLRRKVVITQIWWKSREHTAIHAMVNNALRCGGEKKKKKTRSATSRVMQWIISSPFRPPRHRCYTSRRKDIQKGKINHISHSSFADTHNAQLVKSLHQPLLQHLHS